MEELKIQEKLREEEKRKSAKLAVQEDFLIEENPNHVSMYPEYEVPFVSSGLHAQMYWGWPNMIYEAPCDV